jgi:hypothetical protein
MITDLFALLSFYTTFTTYYHPELFILMSLNLKNNTFLKLHPKQFHGEIRNFVIYSYLLWIDQTEINFNNPLSARFIMLVLQLII